ncbi:hypothetical protein FV232_17125 [Methylobacterium sp. WL30]|uniref:hypothetical protein n=1 Tax=unclassified Methylobacterium TaxID=2615210 RepID=UPI0011C799B2|nr:MULTISPECIES: hypothetical protein [unclassified Methylobacterium]TXN41703.1 hypothetical protein FV225_01545 [Methylobacterium sp. WL93]TXN51059.1 hypothetical protein FV227_09605 [Methylobacterium sp. WL119]TXN65813.1 hypothetical protein FV232_17125 [Methylobacterium sp. WL30]TXN75121.1 hypothetical protein FV228_04485 [Methylobacterium sp. WL18]
MSYRRERLLNDDEVEAGIAAAGSLAAYAKLKGVTPGLVSNRLSRIRYDRGEPSAWNVSWDDKLKFQPTRAAVLKLLASHGVEACKARWGEPPSYLLKRARS